MSFIEHFSHEDDGMYGRIIMKELEQKAVLQIESGEVSFMHEGCSYEAERDGSVINVFTFGRGGRRLVHFFTVE